MRRGFRFRFAAILVVAVLCIAAWLFGAYSSSQVVVSCASAPKKPFSTPPTALTSAQDYFTQGDYDYERGNCEMAIADYTVAIERNPNFAEAYNNRAYIYMVQKDYATALSDLDRAIQLRPTYVNALMNRGDIYNYYYAINRERAVADYDQVLRIDPSAVGRTSVCGHRLLALNHGWNLNVFGGAVDRRSQRRLPRFQALMATACTSDAVSHFSFRAVIKYEC